MKGVPYIFPLFAVGSSTVPPWILSIVPPLTKLCEGTVSNEPFSVTA